MTRPRGTSMLEVMFGVLAVSGLVALLPAFVQQVILVDVLWERRLALRLVETKLEQACNLVTPNNFNALISQGIPDAEFPPGLAPAPGSAQTVTCLDSVLNDAGINGNGTCPGGEQLKRVRVTVNWNARGNRVMTQLSADYLISQAGTCGTGI